jgi:hypothetical protein
VFAIRHRPVVLTKALEHYLQLSARQMNDDRRQKNATPSFTMRLDPALRADLEKLAEADKRSLANYIQVALTEHVQRKKREQEGSK